MKFIIFFLCVFLYSLSAVGQIGMGKWKMYVSPNLAKDVVHGDGEIFCILESGLLEYDTQAGEQTLWTAANYLSDVSPTAIAYHNKSKNLIIGYESGNIDLLKNNSIYNLPHLFKSNTTGLKRINQIVINEDYAFLVTGVGIVVLNLNKKEIKDTYHPSSEDLEYLDIAFYNDSVYVLTQNEIFVSNFSNPFLADPSQWKKMPNIPNYSDLGKYKEIEVFNEQLFLVFNHEFLGNSDTVFQIINGEPIPFFDEKEFFGICGQENELFVSTYDGIYIFDQTLTQKEVIFQYGEGIKPRPRNVFGYDGFYYVADRNYGLVRVRNSFDASFLNFDGPRYNSAYRAEWLKGKLSIACGGFSGTSPSYNLQGGAIKENGKWISTVISEQQLLKDAKAWDFICTSINPKNTNEVAFGTLSGIPLVITNNGVVTDTFGLSSSLIEETGNTGWGYISDVVYDENGNLWIANAYGNTPIKVLTDKGLWYEFEPGSASKNKITNRLMIDQNNVVWLSVKNAGMFAFDYGSNLEDQSDDRNKTFNTGGNSGNLPSNTIEAMAADFDNNIWVGTPEGLRVLYNTTDFFDASPGEYNFQKLLIQYGEYVEIVLGTTHITAIKIDGANRKWIGTASSGVFLLSPDGLEVEKNFTAENSPLLSNSILDITIDHENGEVYFVTEKGLISYRSDASQGDIEYTNVKVFPNPIYPDYEGPITIQGIAYDSDVKITDVSGKLVYKTKSHGGTATWSGKTMDGNRASTGVYLIWTSVDNDEFKGRKVGKVVLIN